MKKFKKSSVILQVWSNGTYSQRRFRKLLLILRNLFLVEPIFKIGSLKLLSKKFRFVTKNIEISRPDDIVSTREALQKTSVILCVYNYIFMKYWIAQIIKCKLLNVRQMWFLYVRSNMRAKCKFQYRPKIIIIIVSFFTI